MILNGRLVSITTHRVKNESLTVRLCSALNKISTLCKINIVLVFKIYGEEARIQVN
jgi:hypothetical protein